MTHSTQVWGWSTQPTAATDPVTDSTGITHHFGHYPVSPGEFPFHQQTVRPVYVGGNREPTRIQIPKITQVDHQVGHWMVNGMPLYFFLGDSATVGSVHTTKVLDIGNQPKLAWRHRSRGPGTTTRSVLLDCQQNMLSLRFEKENPALYAVQGFQALQTKDPPTYDGNITPTWAGSADDVFKYDTNTVFTWNSQSYKEQLVSFQYTGVVTTRPRHIIGQQLPYDLLQGERYLHSIQFVIETDVSDQLIVDYLTPQNPAALEDLNFKLYASATDYIDLKFTDCALSAVKLPYTNPANDNALWIAEGIAAKFEAPIVDGLADSYYGD